MSTTLVFGGMDDGYGYENRNDLCEVLGATASFLAEGVYGTYRLTISDHADVIISSIALVAVSSGFKPMPAMLRARTDDEPAMRLLHLAALIQPRPMTVNLGFGPTVIDLATGESDALTVGISSSAVIPPLIIRDAAAIRERIRETAKTHAMDFSNCSTPRDVMLRIGGLAGRQWNLLAERLLSGRFADDLMTMGEAA